MSRMLSFPTLGLMLSPLLLLASCGKQSAPQAGATASGEVLPGTVNDAMLDTDRSQAEAPLAPGAASSAKKIGAATATSASEPADDASAGAANTEQPSEPPAAAAVSPKPKPAATSKPPVVKSPVAKPTAAKPTAG